MTSAPNSRVRTFTAGFLLAVVCATVPALGLQQRGAPPPKTKPGPTSPWPDAKTMEDRRRSAQTRRLFRVTEPLEFTLTANFKALNGDRDPNSTKTFPGTIDFAKDDGTPISVPVTLSGRGHARRQICSFQPIRIEFPKDKVKDTVFDGHGPLKLGTHCRNEYEEFVLREYAAYRIYNLLTPRSFRARLAKATYVDASTKKPIATRYAMFIEDDDDVAKRLEGRIVDLKKLIFRQVDNETVTLMTVFEYMIGNTDMSMYEQHNVRLVQTQNGIRYTIPYDFDYAGLIDAPYAIPGTRLGLVTVRDRLYRGPCRTVDELQPLFEKLRGLKPDVMSIFTSLPGMSDKYRRDAQQYLEDFYKTLDRPGDVKKAFIEGCDGRPYM
jgi:hypothetical protein